MPTPDFHISIFARFGCRFATSRKYHSPVELRHLTNAKKLKEGLNGIIGNAYFNNLFQIFSNFVAGV
jgi:hypothetical protein